MSISNTHFGAQRIAEMLKDCKSIFFVGIGGINMSSLAHISLCNGMRVGGSDRVRSALTDRLSGEGVEVFYQHDANNVTGYDALVYTVAISEDNPEYLCAIADGKPCISRSDYMGYLMTSYQRRIGVSGMHGKSTCTSMCAATLILAGTDPTVLSGAELGMMGGAYRVSDSSRENFLFEACEYMDSFLDFNPNVAVILNIEMDHVDYFKSMEHIKRSYAEFAAIAGCDGCVIANMDDANVRETLVKNEGRVIGFGIDSADADISARNIQNNGGRYAFDIIAFGTYVCSIQLRVSGYHNIYNALASAAVALECGLSGADITRGLEAFGGAARRMEYKGRQNGADVYDDYAHHPTEIRATLEGARGMVGDGGRLFCAFQSHTYSRTAALLDEFADALSLADEVLICDIYAAREINVYGITPEIFAEKIDGARACHGFVEPAEILKRELRAGDVAIVMGAGDVWHVFGNLELEA
ncbi:MAG: UDP-N-acetylmuramate--L-alanine ligase [Clostridia bacterium]|nr:UDP-N-acetylmuramate--L-alanine ligase [Clostridia bacterium]